MLVLAGPASRHVAFQVPWQWISLLAQIAIIWTTTSLIADAWEGTLAMQDLRTGVLLVCCAVVVRFAMDRLRTRAGYLASVDVKRVLREKSNEKLQGLTTLKVYQANQEAAADMDAEGERFRKVTMKVLGMQLNSTAVMYVVAYGGAAIGMVVAPRGSMPVQSACEGRSRSSCWEPSSFCRCAFWAATSTSA